MSLHGVTVTLTGAERLAAAHPQLPISDLVGATRAPAADPETGDTAVEPPPGIEPGRPLRLMSAKGETLGAGVADPENGLVRIWSSPDDDGGTEVRALDVGFFRGHARRALQARQRLGLADGVSAYRLVNGEGDGLGGLSADVYGRFAVVTALSRGLLGHARSLGEAIRTELPAAGLPADGVVLKVRLKAKGGAPSGPRIQSSARRRPPSWSCRRRAFPTRSTCRAGSTSGCSATCASIAPAFSGSSAAGAC